MKLLVDEDRAGILTGYLAAWRLHAPELRTVVAQDLLQDRRTLLDRVAELEAATKRDSTSLAYLSAKAITAGPLPCGHPAQCDSGFGDANPGATHGCLWCEEITAAKKETAVERFATHKCFISLRLNERGTFTAKFATFKKKHGMGYQHADTPQSACSAALAEIEKEGS